MIHKKPKRYERITARRALNKADRSTWRGPQGFRHYQEVEATWHPHINVHDKINHVLIPNGQVSTRVKSKGGLSNGPPQYRQQLYMGGGNEEHNRGRYNYMSDSCSGPHESMWHQFQTSSARQRSLKRIQGENPTIRDYIPTGPALQSPAQNFIKVNSNV